MSGSEYAPPPGWPSGSFSVVYADPPWKFGNRAYQDNGRPPIEPDEHYPVMTTDAICQLPVRQISAKDSALLMWTTDAHMPDALDVVRAWGFEYRTVAFVWLKQYRTGTPCVLVAPWTLKSTEMCLLGVRGNPKRAAHNVRALIAAERTQHSRKPDEAMERIEALFGDVPRLELFARRARPGWTAWGNEVEANAPAQAGAVATSLEPVVRQCGNCVSGFDLEDRYDQVRCIDPKSSNYDGSVEATDVCDLWMPKN